MIDAASDAATGTLQAIADGFVGAAQSVGAVVAEELASIGTYDGIPIEAAGVAGTIRWLAIAVAVGAIMGSVGFSALTRQGLAGVLREIPTTLIMLSGWYAAAGLLFAVTNEFTAYVLDDTVPEALGTPRWDAEETWSLVLLFSVAMTLFLCVLLIELLVLNHLMILAVIVAPITLALRPIPQFRDASRRMVSTIVVLACTPAISVLSLRIAVALWGSADGVLDIKASLATLAGLCVAVLAPSVAWKFIPIGEGGTPARGMLAAGVTAGVAAGSIVATGGAGAPAGTQAQSLSGSSGQHPPPGPGGGPGVGPGGGPGPGPGSGMGPTAGLDVGTGAGGGEHRGAGLDGGGSVGSGGAGGGRLDEAGSGSGHGSVADSPGVGSSPGGDRLTGTGAGPSHGGARSSEGGGSVSAGGGTSGDRSAATGGAGSPVAEVGAGGTVAGGAGSTRSGPSRSASAAQRLMAARAVVDSLDKVDS